MSKYICDRCNRPFSRKYNYDRHTGRKMRCIKKNIFKNSDNPVIYSNNESKTDRRFKNDQKPIGGFKITLNGSFDKHRLEGLNKKLRLKTQIVQKSLTISDNNFACDRCKYYCKIGRAHV